MAKLIGTAGHVDHGKTSLIRALTGIDADRLPEEKVRGMTIDIGFAYLDLPPHGRVSIVDVPGHERFIHNMLVGALGIDVALLCVAADEGVKPQTREHLQILELLPVEKMAVALTRADLADEDTQELAKLEVAELLEPTRFKGAEITPVSVIESSGLDTLRATLARLLTEAEEHQGGPWYLPVDRVFSVKGHGCVVTGTLAQGTVREGDAAALEPGGIEVRVRAIHTHGDAQTESERGRRTALNLSGVKLEDVRRGMALGQPGTLFASALIDADVNWIKRPRHSDRVRVSIGAEEAIGRVLLPRDEADPIVQLRLEQPAACAVGQPLVIRRYSPPELLGGGKVAVPVGKPRRRSEQAKVVQGGDLSQAVLSAVGESPEGTTTDEVCRLLGKTPQALGEIFELLTLEGSLLGFAGLWFQPTAFGEAADKVIENLKLEHDAKPNHASIPREIVLKRAGLKWQGKPLDRIIAHLVAAGKLEASGTSIRRAGFKVQLTPRQREFLDRVVAEISKEAINTPSAHDLAKTLGAPPQAVEEILKVGRQAGEVVAVGEGVFFTPQQVERLKALLSEKLGSKPFPASAARDLFGTTRKYAIPLLEYFDSMRFTTRIGDLRAVNRAEPSPK